MRPWRTVSESLSPRWFVEPYVYSTLAAGIPLTKVAGSNTSVLTGPPTHDYHGSTTRDEENLPRFPPTDPAMASNWISHFFDLRGKSMSINTGCSTTALHLAILSLRSGEVDMSIVGGSNLMLNPDMIKTMNSSGSVFFCCFPVYLSCQTLIPVISDSSPLTANLSPLTHLEMTAPAATAWLP